MVMKKIAKYMITAAVAVLSAACISETESVHPAGELQEMVFSAVYDVATKTVLTDNNESIIQIEMITAGALLGVTSITSIWKDKTPKRNRKMNNE